VIWGAGAKNGLWPEQGGGGIFHPWGRGEPWVGGAGKNSGRGGWALGKKRAINPGQRDVGGGGEFRGGLPNRWEEKGLQV